LRGRYEKIQKIVNEKIVEEAGVTDKDSGFPSKIQLKNGILSS
jgi:hypothetical protein